MTKARLAPMRNGDYALKEHATVCGYETSVKFSYFMELPLIKTKHRLYKCKYCNKKPFSKRALSRHLTIRHNIFVACCALGDEE